MPAGDAAQAPPIAHAIGGALGSAFALLLFFPLERARIELQAQVASSSSSSSSPNAELSLQQRQLRQNAKTIISKKVTSNTIINAEMGDVVSNEDLESVDVQINMILTSTETPTKAMDLVMQPKTDSPSTSSWASMEGKKEEKELTPPSWSIASEEEEENDDQISDSSDEFSKVEGRPPQLQQPLLTTKTKAQVGPEGLLPCLVRLHERRALYQGVTPVITTIATSQFVFFYLNEAIKQLLVRIPRVAVPPRTTTGHPQQQQQPPLSSTVRRVSPLLALLASCLAGIGNVLITSPLWVCNMTIITGQTETNSLWGELRKMIRSRGWKHLWNGTSASLILVSNPVIQFFCYEQLKRAVLAQRYQRQQPLQPSSFRHNNNSLKTHPSLVPLPLLVPNILVPYEAFLVGALAKAVATTATYPIQLAQTLLRLKDNSYRGTWHCLSQLYRDGGMRKLFTGMRAKLLQTVLTAAFTFLTYGM
jgi:solute carrier family 25 (peroxisomal adenine nucleotide transporter), member 17